MREHRIGFGGMAHIFLNAEIGHRQAEIERRRHAHRRQVGRAVAAGADLIEIGKRRDPAQMADAASVDHRRADIVDQLLLDKLLGVPDRIEDLADRERGGGVLADQPEAGLVLGRGRVLEPEQPVRLEILAEPAGLDRGQTMMDVVEQMNVPAERIARFLEQLGDVAHIFRG